MSFQVFQAIIFFFWIRIIKIVFTQETLKSDDLIQQAFPDVGRFYLFQRSRAVIDSIKKLNCAVDDFLISQGCKTYLFGNAVEVVT